jgi:TolB-like protein/KaiC/GvpD/RAD55 family RecA-like ATPase/Tfp pilus assembly protein PilF
VASCGVPALDRVLVEGYPRRSAILIEGPSGNEREVLAYRFIQSGLQRGDFCAYVTRVQPSDVVSDAKAFEVDFGSPAPCWMSPEEGDRKYSPNDLATISFGIKEMLKGREGGLLRVAFDGLSQLLMLHSADSVYRFLGQLLPELKKSDAVLVATVQEDMHQPQVLASIELLFDGVIVVGRSAQGEMEIRVKKMRGLNLSAQTAPLKVGGAKATGASLRPRVAVLPFTNISPDPNDAYVSDGLTEELISTLSKIEGLEVIARTSVMRYKGSPKPITEVSRELGVGTILQGSTRKAGNKIRVGVQMIDAEHEGHLWSENYDRELSDIFAIQTEISEKVAEHVKLEFAKGGAARSGAPREDPVAYDFYLRGRHRLNAGPQGFGEAAKLFGLAIERDPKMARAYAGLADYYSYIADDPMPAAEAYPLAKKNAETALELDPNLSDAHVSLALIAFLYDWDWAAAEHHFAEAVALNPNNAFAHQWNAIFLKSIGRFDDAAKSLKAARGLDPLSDSIVFATAVLHYIRGENELAMEEAKRAIEMNRNSAAPHGVLGALYLERDDREHAISEAKEGDRAEGDSGARGLIGYLYGRLGEREEAEKILEELERGTGDPFVKGQVLEGMGERERAVEEFRKALEGHSSFLAIFYRNRYLDEAFKDPRLSELLVKVGLKRA